MNRAAAFVVVMGWLLAGQPTAYAADNIGAVQEALKQKHEKVVFGKHLDHVEYVKFAAALPGGPPAVAAYLEEFIASVLKETGSAVAKETVFDLLTGKNENTIVGSRPVYVGVATYNHWTHEKYPEINLGRVKWGTIKVPRPNTHQLYVAIGKRGSPPPPPDQAQQTVADRRETIRREYVHFLNSEVAADWLDLYEPHLRVHGLEVLRDAIVSDHAKSMILELYQSLVGEGLSENGLNLYRKHLRNHGHQVLERAIVSDYAEKVVKNTYRKVLFADPPAGWLQAYQPYVKAHGVRTLESQIIADRPKEVVQANFRFLIGREVPDDWCGLYQPHVKAHGVWVLRGAIVSDHGEGAIKEAFRKAIGRDIPADWLDLYKPHLRAHGMDVLRKAIESDHKK